MNTLSLSTAFELFCEWLWATSIEASVLIALVWLLHSVLGKWLRPTWRYALGLLVLFRLMLPAAPSSQFSIFNLRPRLTLNRFLLTEDSKQSVSTSAAPASLNGPPAESAGTANTAEPILGSNRSIQPSQVAMKPLDGAPKLVSADGLKLGSAGPGTRLGRAAPSWKIDAGWVWLGGFVLMLFGILVRHWKFSRWVRRQAAVTNEPVLALLRQCQNEMRVTRPVQLIRTDGLSTPALFGLRKPCLLIPENVLSAYGLAELRMVFLHELAHVRRGDILLNWLMIGVRALHWFNPLVWLALRRLRSDRELICDEMVLARLHADERTQYGHTLIKLLNDFSRAGFCPSLAPAINHKHEIKRRITMIAQFKPASGIAGILSAALALVVCAFTFTRAEDPRLTFDGRKADDSRTAATIQDERLTREASIVMLERRVVDQEKVLRAAVQRMDDFRIRFQLADIGEEKSVLGSILEPETMRMLERDRVTAEAESARYGTLLERLKPLEKKELRQSILTVSPDTQLSNLMAKLSESEQKLAVLSNELGPEHVEFKKLKSLIANLNSDIDDRVQGILSGLKTLSEASKTRADVIQKKLSEFRQADARNRERYQPYFDAKQAVETQTRIYESVQLRLLQEKVDLALSRTQLVQDRKHSELNPLEQSSLNFRSTNSSQEFRPPPPNANNPASPVSVNRDNRNTAPPQGPAKDGSGESNGWTRAFHERQSERTLGQTNRWNQAIPLLEGLLVSSGTNPVKRGVQQLALLELAGVAENAGQLDYAIRLLTEYAEKYRTDPIVPELYLRQGLLYRRMPDYGRAISKFYLVMTGALRNKTTTNQEYYQRLVLTAQSEIAETTFMSGKFDEAARYYEMLLKNPSKGLNRTVVQTKLIRSLAKAGDSAGVIKQGTEYLREHPDSDMQGEIRGLLATAYESLGQKDESRRVLNGVSSKGAAPSSQEKSSVARKRDPGLPIPLTREIISSEVVQLSGPRKLDERDSAIDVTGPDKIVVNIANSNGRSYAVTRISMIGPGDDLIERINKNRERLLDAATGIVSSKTAEEIHKPGFRNVLRTELMDRFNGILGAGSLSEIVITEFLTQENDPPPSEARNRPDQKSGPEAPVGVGGLRTDDLIKVFVQNPEFRENRSLSLRAITNGVVIEFLNRPKQPIFETGTNSAELTTYGSWVVKTVAWEIGRRPFIRIELEGHTPTGSESAQIGLTDWDVSTMRANSARKLLLDSGVKDSQIVKLAGYGGRKPLETLDSRAPENGRITMILHDTSNLEPRTSDVER